MKIKFTFFLFLYFSFSSVSWSADNNEAPNLSSPYQTVLTHLRYLQQETYDVEKAAQALHPSFSAKERKELAVDLKQIFDGRGLYVEVEELPRSPDYYDSARRDYEYILFKQLPVIFLEKVGDKWYYSKRTVERIPELHDDTYILGTDILLNLLPHGGSKKIFNLYTWQYIGILILLISIVVLHKILIWILDQIFAKALKYYGSVVIQKKLLMSVSKPLSLLIIFFLLTLFVPVLQLPIETSRYVIIGLKAALPIFVTVMAYQLVNVFSAYLEELSKTTESTLDDQLVPLVRKSLKMFVIVIGAVFVLHNLNFNISALLAGISIGGLALALAAQDTLKNLFGSIMIFIDRPFQVGDWIVAPDIDGTVEEVGFRSTRVRTFHNSQTYVPNGKIADMVVDNMGRRQYRRYSTKLAVQYDTPPHLIEIFVEGLRKIVEEHPHTRKDVYHIYTNDMNAYSIDILFYIFFAVPTWAEELRCRHEVILEIMKLAERLGVGFAFPTQTLHMENFPGQPSLSKEYEQNPDVLKDKI